MVIVKFANTENKFELFKHRVVLRQKKIRISNDLTYIQRQQLKEAKQQGYNAYFKNGELHKSQKENTEGNRFRGRPRTLDDRNRQYLSRQDDNITDTVNVQDTNEVNANTDMNGYR